MSNPVERDATYYKLQLAAAEKEIANLIEERATDSKRLDWIEGQARKSTTGISFDRVPSLEGEPSGFRFMRRFYIGEPHKSIRASIDAEMDHNPPTR